MIYGKIQRKEYLLIIDSKANIVYIIFKKKIILECVLYYSIPITIVFYFPTTPSIVIIICFPILPILVAQIFHSLITIFKALLSTPISLCSQVISSWCPFSIDYDQKCTYCSLIF